MIFKGPPPHLPHDFFVSRVTFLRLCLIFFLTPFFSRLFLSLGRSEVPSGAQHCPKTSPRGISGALLGRTFPELGRSSFLNTPPKVLLQLWCPRRSLGELGSLKKRSSDTRCVRSVFALKLETTKHWDFALCLYRTSFMQCPARPAPRGGAMHSFT